MIKSIRFIDTGFCRHSKFIVDPRIENIFQIENYHAFATLIEHSQKGLILFDTGYAPHFIQETKSFPESLYRMVTPVFDIDNKSLKVQLKQIGIKPEDINYIILSHFHADHISGCKDFPRAKFIFKEKSFQELMELTRFMRLKNAFLSGLIPDDFMSRTIPISAESFKIYDDSLLGFEYGSDIFGDGSMLIINLPGHAIGHIGLILRTQSEQYFMIGDAAWTSESVKENSTPFIVSQLIMNNSFDYKKTLNKLNQLAIVKPENLTIVPCHCGKNHFLKNKTYV